MEHAESGRMTRGTPGRRRLSRWVAAAALVLGSLHPAPSAAAEIPWKLPSYTLVARNMDLRTALDTFAVAQGVSVTRANPRIW